MGNVRFTEDFKIEAIKQIIDLHQVKLFCKRLVGPVWRNQRLYVTLMPERNATA
jgi:hypothetical protein